MKTLTLLSLAAFLLSPISSLAASFEKGISCSGYRSTRNGGVTYDASKYTIDIASAKPGTNKREAILYKTWSDGSNIVGYTADACKMNDEKLICSINGVSVTIDTNASDAKSEESFTAKFYHLLLGVSRTGTCKIDNIVDSTIDWAKGRTNIPHYTN